MSLIHILAFSIFALLVGSLARGRSWLLMAGSLLAIYWMQPAMPIRYLDFWLPTASLALAVSVWALTRPAASKLSRNDLMSAGLLVGLVLAIGLTRYIEPLCCLNPTRPPALGQIFIFLSAIILIVAIFAQVLAGKSFWLNGLVLAIILLFILLKTEPLARLTSLAFRIWMDQDARLANPLDLRWLGFSYMAFRLLHTLRDRLAGRLPELSLQEYVIYILFFPAFTAGPIDRVQRFLQDLRRPFHLTGKEFFSAGQRILLGVFQKFVLADSLALLALNAFNASQVTSGGWMWVLLYAYAFRIYFDFSGYTDIALGVGRLVGVQLPENFDRPYRKANLTMFWNSWHITLAQWLRAYFFTPFTRALRSKYRKLPVSLIIFLGQISTMLLVGLWHGVTWNFAAWGLWHGIGLFIHNRWLDAVRPRLTMLEGHLRMKQLVEVGGILLTFHYVTLGWVWFALPQLEGSWLVLLTLFGLQS